MFIGTCSKETKEEIQHTYIKEVPSIWSDLIDSKWFRGLFRTIGRSFGTLTVSRHFDMFTGSEILFKYKVIYHFIGVIFQMGQSAKIHFPMPCGTRSFQTGNVKWQPHKFVIPISKLLAHQSLHLPHVLYLVVQFAHFHPLVVLLLHLETGDCDPEVPLSHRSASRASFFRHQNQAIQGHKYHPERNKYLTMQWSNEHIMLPWNEHILPEIFPLTRSFFLVFFFFRYVSWGDWFSEV